MGTPQCHAMKMSISHTASYPAIENYIVILSAFCSSRVCVATLLLIPCLCTMSCHPSHPVLASWVVAIADDFVNAQSAGSELMVHMAATMQQARRAPTTPRHDAPRCRHATLPSRHATPRHATPRHATPRRAAPRRATPRHAAPRHSQSVGPEARVARALGLGQLPRALVQRHLHLRCGVHT